ncbi:Predicted arabinose efflux permease, MFS family [Curtobacterium sp. UNCCL20]|uniref:MFS transporter n=1 Tax=Curtobacterium sp. UNCCL20 TaxID=1502773 RepID=UPI0008823524|nr:MFS transporter [Curtobacterium sp. UNCCL20]SDQ28559.1 Predicted arabinose efflux permease, MFS family [Curtobacterium sp. UNCCL20]
MTTQRTTTTPRSGALAPLAIPVFRALWIAVLVSNIGSWMQTVGAQWLLVDEHAAPVVVALVQTASSLPVLLIGIPAGVVGEFVDRRRLLIGVQAFQVVVGAAMTVLTATGSMTPALLLTVTFLLGSASALQLPAYQALVPEIVPRAAITDAAALSSVGVNVARAIGPALAGVVIAQLGVPFVFAANALSFALFLVVLVAWRGYQRPETRAEPFVDATRAGVRYVLHAGVVRRLLVQLAVFMVPANALWALLPLVANGPLGLSSGGYGLLLAAVGAGSVGGAFVMPAIRRRLGIGRVVGLTSVVFGAAMVVVALVPSLPVVLVALVIGGVAWIGVVTTLNGTVQAFLPAWVRARGLAVYQLVLFGSTAVGAALAGVVATPLGVVGVLAAAGVLTALGAGLLLVSGFPVLTDRQRAATPMPLSDVAFVPDDHAAATGETLVLLHWTVPAGSVDEFRARAARLGKSRRRTGARDWNLYRDAATGPDAWVEAFRVGSWQEHVDQHEVRQTGDDARMLEAVREVAGEPRVEHLVAVGVSSPSSSA